MFPEVQEPLRRCAFMWDLERKFPRPKFDVKCPICGTNEFGIKDWKFHFKASSKTKYRCDVVFKCLWCSLVWTHGMVIPRRLAEEHNGRHYTWRQVKQIEEKIEKGEPCFDVIVYVLNDNRITSEWRKDTQEIITVDDLFLLECYKGTIAIDLAYYDPHDVELRKLVKKIAKATATVTISEAMNIIKLTGTPINE